MWERPAGTHRANLRLRVFRSGTCLVGSCDDMLDYFDLRDDCVLAKIALCESFVRQSGGEFNGFARVDQHIQQICFISPHKSSPPNSRMSLRRTVLPLASIASRSRRSAGRPNNSVSSSSVRTMSRSVGRAASSKLMSISTSLSGPNSSRNAEPNNASSTPPHRSQNACKSSGGD